MNPDLPEPVVLTDPNLSLREIHSKKTNENAGNDGRVSFEMISEIGEIVGYLKVWHHDDDYTGFVQFDADGDIVDWKTSSRREPS